MSELSTEKSGPPPSWISLSIYVLPSSVFPFAMKLANPGNFVPTLLKLLLPLQMFPREIILITVSPIRSCQLLGWLIFLSARSIILFREGILLDSKAIILHGLWWVHCDLLLLLYCLHSLRYLIKQLEIRWNSDRFRSKKWDNFTGRSSVVFSPSFTMSHPDWLLLSSFSYLGCRWQLHFSVYGQWTSLQGWSQAVCWLQSTMGS